MPALSLHDFMANLPPAERDRLAAAAQQFEATEAGGEVDALPVDAWILPGGVPLLVFAWPVDEVDTDEILHGVLLGARPAERLMYMPSGWLRIVSPVSDLRRRELDAAEALAQEFRDALLRPGKDTP